MSDPRVARVAAAIRAAFQAQFAETYIWDRADEDLFAEGPRTWSDFQGGVRLADRFDLEAVAVAALAAAEGPVKPGRTRAVIEAEIATASRRISGVAIQGSAAELVAATAALSDLNAELAQLGGPAQGGQRAIIAGVERFPIPYGPNTVQCDVKGCGAETYVERRWTNADAPKLARAEAAAKGWGFVKGRDLCPEHLAKVHATPGETG